MKKRIYITLLTFLLLLLFSACSKKNTGNENNENTEGTNKPEVSATPSPEPIVTLPPKEVTDRDNSDTDTKEDIKNLKAEDYYPIQADTEYIYEGKGNEYASYNRYIDFVDVKNNTFQTRTDNGGTVSIRVIEIKDGKVTVKYMVNEGYYRDNLLDKSLDTGKIEVLLMEPLVMGTEWKLQDGSKRTISGLDVDIDTPSGKYKALEVTTEGKDSITKEYYAPKIGLVKSVFTSKEAKGMEVSSTLSKINTNALFAQNIDIYYPGTDEKIHVEPLTLSFHTGDVTRLILQEALKKEANKEAFRPLVSANTKINSLYLGEDKIVYADFSSDLVKEMNAGIAFETLTLQSIANTLGSYYGVEKVYITVDGKPYESGHILMKKGETLRVNMDAVVR